MECNIGCDELSGRDQVPSFRNPYTPLSSTRIVSDKRNPCHTKKLSWATLSLLRNKIKRYQRHIGSLSCAALSHTIKRGPYRASGVVVTTVPLHMQFVHQSLLEHQHLPGIPSVCYDNAGHTRLLSRLHRMTLRHRSQCHAWIYQGEYCKC